MGQKTHPIGLRLGIVKTWNSRWFEEAKYRQWLLEDLKLRNFLKKKLSGASIAEITIERAASKVKINIFSGRPGIIIGKRGAGVEALRKEVQKMTESKVFLNIQEVRKAEVNAQLVAENICQQLQRRIAYRRALKRAVHTAMKFGALGIRVNAQGRLGGSEMRRREWYLEGRVPLHTLRADIQYGAAVAHTAAGTCGVKCWIFKGEVYGNRSSTVDPRFPRPAKGRG